MSVMVLYGDQYCVRARCWGGCVACILDLVICNEQANTSCGLVKIISCYRQAWVEEKGTDSTKIVGRPGTGALQSGRMFCPQSNMGRDCSTALCPANLHLGGMCPHRGVRCLPGLQKSWEGAASHGLLPLEDQSDLRWLAPAAALLS